jgi:flavodoxin/ferredoxin
MDGVTVLESKNQNKGNTFKIALMYFSATGNTKKIADVVEESLTKLAASVTKIDITSYEARKEQMSLREYDAVIFGFPIYSLRAPRVCRQWLETLNGEGKKCSVFFTFGGFGKDPAHYYIKELLDKRNFTLVSTAEILAVHTFNRCGWQAAEGRPNQSDFEVVEEYADKTLNRFTGEDTDIIHDFKKPAFPSEQLDMAEKFRFKLITQLPNRDARNCSMCMLCEKLCPTNAMDAKKGIADSTSCIACFRCIANCPDGVLHTNDISATWENKLQMHNTTKEDIDHMASRIFL